jgi:hypothetical protein
MLGLDSAGSECNVMMDTCEADNEPLGSIKAEIQSHGIFSRISSFYCCLFVYFVLSPPPPHNMDI